MRILIVEDEHSIRSALTKGFMVLGYAVDEAQDGKEAIDLYYSYEYDIILLDLNLPILDGLEVLKEIREEDKSIPVLILSARDEVEDKIKGLDLGANDYLEKPFHFKELEARVRALLRRDFSTKSTTLQHKEIKIDTALKKVYKNNIEIELTLKEYGILEYLFYHLGEIVSGEELIEHVWNENADEFSNSFKVHISNLRKKLPEDIIITMRGEGYYVPKLIPEK